MKVVQLLSDSFVIIIEQWHVVAQAAKKPAASKKPAAKVPSMLAREKAKAAAKDKSAAKAL